MKSREQFSGRWAAIFAMAGSAIGLGNIWRFPYMVGQNGGAAFVLLYIVFVFFLSLPIFLCESVIGRSSHSNTFGAMRTLAPGTAWKWLGLLTVLSPALILSYYSVVGGWSAGFLLESVTKGFAEGSGAEGFAAFTSSKYLPTACNFVFLSLTAIIVRLGVKKGIELFNKISIPLLFVLILAIAVYSLTLPGAGEGVSYLLKPDFSRMGLRSVAYAMGQGFFSLSLGVGTVLVYSSYMSKSEDLVFSASGTAVFDMFFALIAGFAVIPAVFSAGIEPGAGPGLVFETLPYVFGSMGAVSPLLSRVVSVLFFLTLLVAALTSSISMLEVVVAYLSEERGMTRRAACLLSFAVILAASTLVTLSFGPLKDVRLAGMPVMDFLDTLTSNYFMTAGALLFVIFVGWKMDKARVRDELTLGGSVRRNCILFEPLYFMIRYVAPLVIVLIFITNFIL